jgi:hypothetical protein
VKFLTETVIAILAMIAFGGVLGFTSFLWLVLVFGVLS